jgi:hypothetical protein
VKESESVSEFVEKTTQEYAKAKSGAFAYLLSVHQYQNFNCCVGADGAIEAKRGQVSLCGSRLK